MKTRIHKRMMVDVQSYSAIHVQAAIALMQMDGAPDVAALEVKRVGSYEYPRTLVTLEWSVPVEYEV
jgi:hypothetical protein